MWLDVCEAKLSGWFSGTDLVLLLHIGVQLFTPRPFVPNRRQMSECKYVSQHLAHCLQYCLLNGPLCPLDIIHVQVFLLKGPLCQIGVQLFTQRPFVPNRMHVFLTKCELAHVTYHILLLGPLCQSHEVKSGQWFPLAYVYSRQM